LTYHSLPWRPGKEHARENESQKHENLNNRWWISCCILNKCCTSIMFNKIKYPCSQQKWDKLKNQNLQSIQYLTAIYFKISKVWNTSPSLKMANNCIFLATWKIFFWLHEKFISIHHEKCLLVSSWTAIYPTACSNRARTMTAIRTTFRTNVAHPADFCLVCFINYRHKQMFIYNFPSPLDDSDET
jgi:hypothetical protein